MPASAADSRARRFGSRQPGLIVSSIRTATASCGSSFGPRTAIAPSRTRAATRVPAAPLDTAEGQAPPEKPDRAFSIRETVDPDQALRLTPVGDLDLTGAQTLTRRLADIKTTGRRTRLDLSRLEFIDSAGIQALLLALTDARWDGWQLEIARVLSPSVQRAAEIVGIGQVLWPQDRGHGGVPQADANPTSPA